MFLVVEICDLTKASTADLLRSLINPAVRQLIIDQLAQVAVYTSDATLIDDIIRTLAERIDGASGARCPK